MFICFFNFLLHFPVFLLIFLFHFYTFFVVNTFFFKFRRFSRICPLRCAVPVIVFPPPVPYHPLCFPANAKCNRFRRPYPCVPRKRHQKWSSVKEKRYFFACDPRIRFGRSVSILCSNPETAKAFASPEGRGFSKASPPHPPENGNAQRPTHGRVAAVHCRHSACAGTSSISPPVVLRRWQT